MALTDNSHMETTHIKTKTFHPVCLLGYNSTGRDFVVASLRGNTQALDYIMESVRFDPKKDRIITLGNLFHDSCDWRKIALLLTESWFVGVRGWQEHLLQLTIAELKSESTEQHYLKLWTIYFGTGIFDLPKETLELIEQRLAYWPYIAKHVSPKAGVRTALMAKEVDQAITIEDFIAIAKGAAFEESKPDALGELTFLLTGIKDMEPIQGKHAHLVEPAWILEAEEPKEKPHGDSLFAAMKYEEYKVKQHAEFERVLTGEVVNAPDQRLNTIFLNHEKGMPVYRQL